MFKRSILRMVSIFVALVAGVAVSAHAALAVNLPDPIGPVPGGGSGIDRLVSVPVAPDDLQILGMHWQLALSIALLAVAMALALATMVQRRHVVHA